MRLNKIMLVLVSLLATCALVSLTSSSSDADEICPDDSTYSYQTYGTEHPNYYCKITKAHAMSSVLHIPTVLEGYDVTIIASGSFDGCLSTDIIIPKMVKTIEADAFTSCTNLTKVFFMGDCPMMEGAFESGVTFYRLPGASGYPSEMNILDTTDTNGITYCHFPDGWMVLGGVPTEGIVTIQSEINGVAVTSIGPYSFSGTMQSTGEVSRRSDIKEIILPESVTDIRERSFYYSDLRTIKLPDSLESIHDEAFRAAYFLEDTKFPDKLEYIGFECFRDCHALTKLTIDNVSFLGDGAFYICESLETVSIQTSSDIPNRLFGYCLKLGSVEISGSLKSVGNLSFYNCFALRTITLPHSVKSLGNASFFSCSNLEKVDLGLVETIGSECFRNCTALNTLSLPESLQTIGSYCFADCTGLTTVNAYCSCPSSNTTIFLNDPVTVHCSKDHYESWKTLQPEIDVQSDLDSTDNKMIFVIPLALLLVLMGIVIIRKLHR